MNQAPSNTVRLAFTFFKWLTPTPDQASLEANFELMYAQIAQQQGTRAAQWWLWSQLFRSLPGFISATL